jgi:hypothetical protein
MLYHTLVFILLPIYSIVFLLFYSLYILYVVYISHVIGSGLQKHVYIFHGSIFSFKLFS